MTEHKQHMGEMRNECQIFVLVRGKKALGPKPGWENSIKIYIKENTIDCCGQDSIAEIYGPIVSCCEKDNAYTLFITMILILPSYLWREIIVLIPLGAEVYVLSRLYSRLLKLTALQRNAPYSTSLPNDSFIH